MKTKSFIVFFLLISNLTLLISQVPQGLNYQAIARGSDGKEIVNTNLEVKISILSDTSGFYGSGSGTYIWEEQHSVRTNNVGLFTLTVGNPLATKVQGSAISFSSIDWKQQPMFIGTKINYLGWRNMGTARLWSVPYSLVAGELEGAVSRLEVKGEDQLSDEALFEVKRKDGHTMFAVYNHGVRVYMPLDTLSKARKGGFAIGGFDKAKGEIQDYFVVNPDSIRAYIDTNPSKARKGGFAIGGFDKAKAGNEEYLRVTRDSTRIYLNDTGTKALKGGFAIGGFDKDKGNIQDFLTVNQDSIRLYINDNPSKALKGGFAIGGFDNAKASVGKEYFNVSSSLSADKIDSASQIIWYPRKEALLSGRVHVGSSDSVGFNSTALGYESVAKGNWSQSFGYKSYALGNYSTAIGKGAVAMVNSFALGNKSRATGDDSYAFGSGAQATGSKSFAFGSVGLDSLDHPTTQNTVASGNYSMALGLGAQSQTIGSISIGVSSLSSGSQSIAIGFESKSNDRYATALGYRSEANGYGAMSLGSQASTSVAAGPPTYSMYVLNSRNIASGPYSIALGSGNYSSNGGITLGTANSSTAYGAVAAGFFNKANGLRSTALGYYNEAVGDMSTVMGTRNTSQSYAALVIGQWSKLEGNSTTWIDTDPLFVAGNGKVVYSGTWQIQRNNAMTLYKNGDLKIGGSFTMGSIMFGHKIYGDTLILNPATGFGSLLRGYPVIDLMERNYSGTPFVPYSKHFYIVVSGKKFQIADETANRLLIDNVGNVGIGTDFPSVKLHVLGDILGTRINANGYSGGAGGINSYSFEIGGPAPSSSNGVATLYLHHHSLIAHQLRYASGVLYLEAAGNGYATSTTPIFSVGGSLLAALNGGSVGIGTASPATKLDVENASLGTYVATFRNGVNHYQSLGIKVSAGTSTLSKVYGSRYIRFSTPDDTEIGSISQVNTTSIAFNTTSDRRLKKNIVETHFTIDDLMKIQVRDFNFINEYNSNISTGFIAQELYEIIPGVVTKPFESKDYWSIDYGKMTPFIVKAVQDQYHRMDLIMEENEQLRSSNIDLQSKVNSLQERIEQIESLLAKTGLK